MFRFLTDRYPLIMQRLDEDHVFDHFYLDMNGIIHQCTHPNDDKIAIENIEEMFASIFEYTERLFRIMAPTKLMFLAVDGVAPRAKMNQQRSRRFRSAKESERNIIEAIERGEEVPEGKPFDSNCITPGTEFMHNLSRRFRAWIHDKMSTDPAWQKGCTVVFSGSEVPGEGEHKIMDHIRSWQKSDQYSPEIRHCMYGLDADLVMLGLVAHAPHFTLLREKMKFSRNGRKVPKMKGTHSDANEFELLEIAMLRDMLFLEFKRTETGDPFERPFDRRSRRPPSKFERKAMLATFPREQSKSMNGTGEKRRPVLKVEARRIVDDFVFMCMLVGNDFIPNLPHLDIAEGAINIMFRVYKELLPTWGGYITLGHKLHHDRLESFLAKLSQSEPDYFDNRAFSDNIAAYKTPAYRREYYKQKFKFDVDGEDGPQNVEKLKRIHMEGLHWVLQYYHNGVSSWNWFYPDFYAVLASDMKNLRSIKVGFQKGRPFRPLTQLMAVLPPASAHFLPAPMSKMMLTPESAVADFYPVDFETDMNGKRNSWEAIVIVPFIEEKRLLAEVNAIDKEKEFTECERKRDEFGPEYWFYAQDYPTSDIEVLPVRTSKYFVPYSERSRSPSSSPTRTPSPQRGVSNGTGRRQPSRRGGGSEHGSGSRSSAQDATSTASSNKSSRGSGRGRGRGSRGGRGRGTDSRGGGRQ